MISEAETDKYLAEILDILEERFNAGDKSALLDAIYHCLLMKRPLPEGLRTKFLHTYESRARFEIRSWDEVFGRPVPKSTHLEKERRNAEWRFRILERVRELAPPIDKGLFDQIGKELGISGTTVSEIYYDKRTRELFEMIYGLPEFSEIFRDY
jgi:hypothetical protein